MLYQRSMHGCQPSPCHECPYLKRVSHTWWLETLFAEAAVMVQALRRDLRALEDDARALAAELEDATDWNPGQGSLQQLEGRFLCLAGMYKAHSQVSAPGPQLSACLRQSSWQ